MKVIARGTVASAKYRNPCIFTINALCGNKEIIPIKKVIKAKKFYSNPDNQYCPWGLTSSALDKSSVGGS